MKLGLGLYRHMLDRDHMRFARQAGCTHLIVHLAEYYKEVLPATDDQNNYGQSCADDEIWSAQSMIALQNMAREEGLVIYGIENFSPADWYDILLDGPRKEEQLSRCIQIIRNAGKAGIRAFGYNFSLAGVWGHQKLAVARGGAVSACFDAQKLKLDAPIPKGQIWNMTYNSGAAAEGMIDKISDEELWRRLEWFLNRILPAAQEAGVEMALHPDDPPMPVLRQTPRLVYQPDLYHKMIALNPNPANMIELCMGSIQEMSEGNIYDTLETYLSADRISYVHFRNVIGKVPKYREVFVDEGDIDMLKAIRILKKHNFQGVLVPDHTPLMTCGDPWHAGMAYALGYMKLAMRIAEEEQN